MRVPGLAAALDGHEVRDPGGLVSGRCTLSMREPTAERVGHVLTPEIAWAAAVDCQR